MAVDTLDYAVMVALAVAIVAYFGKDYFLPAANKNTAGFLAGGAAGAGAGDVNSRNIVEVLNKTKKKCVVFYGSQTGTAEDYASKLSKELKARFGLQTMTADLADYDFDNLNEVADLTDDAIFFFLLATYGEGEPTDNATEFYEFLNNEADTVNNLKFAVFGLGNSTYEFFNKIGSDVDKKLEVLGGERVAPYGEGDDGKGSMDEDFLSWKESVIEAFKNNLDFEEHELKYEPGLELTEEPLISASDKSVSNGEPSLEYLRLSAGETISKGPFDHTHPFLSSISHTKELFSQTSGRSCVHAEFDLSDSNLRYLTGDHLAVWPLNSNENVLKFLQAFDLEDKKNLVFTIKSLDATISLPFHSPITHDACIRHHLEISGAVSRQFLQAIASFAPTETSKKKATELAGNKDLFAKEIHSRSFNIADALLYISDGLPWTQVPFVFLIESIAHLQPRYYSISSSSLSEKRSIHITAVVEVEELENNRVVSGVVTNLLKDIEVTQNKKSEKRLVTYDLNGPRNKFSNFKLPVHVRRSTFKLPSNPGVPIILIGPGTGVAPFRGFVRERALQASNDSNTTVGKTILFYGCRNSKEDFLYKEEWPEYSKKLGEAFEMHTAFSREDPAKKVYVQHKLAENAKQIDELLLQGAYVYVCGDASRMARDVQHTLTDIISKQRNLPEERGAELVRGLKIQNRYQEDVW